MVYMTFHLALFLIRILPYFACSPVYLVISSTYAIFSCAGNFCLCFEPKNKQAKNMPKNFNSRLGGGHDNQSSCQKNLLILATAKTYSLSPASGKKREKIKTVLEE